MVYKPSAQLSSYLLVAHGSRNRRSQTALANLTYGLYEQKLAKAGKSKRLKIISTVSDRFLQQLPLKYAGESVLVGAACLELASIPLHQQIVRWTEQTKQAGGDRIKILPLFLAPGVHATEDIPAEVNLARQQIDRSMTLEVLPYLGSNGDLPQLIERQFHFLPESGKILLAHGSRLSQSDRLVREIAYQSGAAVAYWSSSPSLTERVASLVAAGKQSIAIAPYFLFPGTITDTLTQVVAQLQQNFPTVRLSLGQPLGAMPQLTNLLLDIFEYESATTIFV